MALLPEECIVCEFCFHGVGHGLFYTGKIGDFSFVYDCGSSSQRKIFAKAKKFVRKHLPEVAEQDRRVKVLPFLFISHLHYDHVSGLEGLLKAGVRVDYAFLPYLSPWERLLLALVLPQGIYQSSRWYLDLLYDPVGFLMEQGVKKVILLTSRGSGRTGRPLQYDPVNIEGLPGYHVYLKGLEPLDETMERSILSEEDSSWKDYRTDGRLWIGVPTPNSNEVRGPVLWEFVLYCVPMSENEIACFREWVAKQPSVRLVLGQRGDTALALLSDPFLLQKLRKRYSKLLPKGENLNFTSLLLWHAPLMENISAMEAGHCLDYGGIHGSLYKTLVECCPQDTWCAFLKLLGWENKLGQFLLGDLNYRQLVKDGGMYNQFRQHFGDRLNATMVCLLPHHGSRRNWDRQILEDMGSAKFWVASAERRRGGYPPHWEVIADITSAGRSFVWVGGTTSGNVSCDTCTNTPQDTDYVVVFTF